MSNIVKKKKNSLQFSAPSTEKSDLISSLGTLYRVSLHPVLLLCNYDSSNYLFKVSVVLASHSRCVLC